MSRQCAAGRIPAVALFGIGDWPWSILFAYLLGARMLSIDRRISAGRAADQAPNEQGGMRRTAALFLCSAVVLVTAGPHLAAVAAELADRSGLGGTFVGTTLVALTTSQPELVASLPPLLR